MAQQGIRKISAGIVQDASINSGRPQPDNAVFNYARSYQMTIITFDTDYLK